MSFSCERCGAATTVIDSRPAWAGGIEIIRRRRECYKCKHRQSTNETMLDVQMAQRCTRSMIGRLTTLRKDVDKMLRELNKIYASPTGEGNENA